MHPKHSLEFVRPAVTVALEACAGSLSTRLQRAPRQKGSRKMGLPAACPARMCSKPGASWTRSRGVSQCWCGPPVQDRPVIIIANLKPRNMRGIKSHGMVLCASNEEHTEVRAVGCLVVPPVRAPPGWNERRCPEHPSAGAETRWLWQAGAAPTPSRQPEAGRPHPPRATPQRQAGTGRRFIRLQRPRPFGPPARATGGASGAARGRPCWRTLLVWRGGGAGRAGQAQPGALGACAWVCWAQGHQRPMKARVLDSPADAWQPQMPPPSPLPSPPRAACLNTSACA